MTQHNQKQTWKTIPLGTLAEFRNGVNFTKANFGRGIKVINVKDFQDRFKPSYEKLGEINPNGVVRENDLLKEDDIVFVRSNGNRQLIGRSLLIKGASEPVTHSAFTIRARFQSPEAFPLFYAYVLRSYIVRDALSAFGSGTNINNLNQGILSNLQVPLPSVSTQRRISEILSAYDELIENNTRRIKILEEIAQALYREWFAHFHFPGHEKVKLVDSSVGLVPKGWEVKRVKHVLKRLTAGQVYTEKTVAASGRVPVIDQSRDDVLGYHNNEPDHTATPDSPVIAFGDHTCKMQLMVEPFSVGPNVVPFVSQNRIPIPYLYFIVRNLVETREYKRHWTELAAKHIVLAPNYCAERFGKISTPMFEQMDALRRTNINLRGTRDLLLPKLITGEVDVMSVRSSEC